MSTPGSGDRRAQLEDALRMVWVYHERGWDGTYTPQGDRRHPLDDFFESLTAQFPLDGDGTKDDQELALLLDVPTRELTGTIGWRWKRERHLPTPDDERIWYVNGEPMQVLLGIGPDGLVVGTPTLLWVGAAHLAMDEEIARLPAALTAEVVEAVTRAQNIRRAQFTYCLRCRKFTAPENGGSTCHGCMQQLDGVVF